jgi:Fic family protein
MVPGVSTMYSLRTEFLAGLGFSPADVATLRSLGEYGGRQQLYVKQRPETLDSLRTVAVIESTDSSNRLEGITAPEARVKALVEHKTEPRDRSEQEIAGYRDALELIHQSGADMPVTTNVIRQLHKTIYGYMPDEGGDWKMIDNEIVERDAKGNIIRVRFAALSAVATPQGMEDLIQCYRQALNDGQDAMIVIPLFVLDFLCIHPFRDGNGRVARLLTLLLLYHAGYEVGRYISLDRLIEVSWESYYETLEASSHDWHESQHDVMPWLTYFWGVLIRAYKEFEERVGDVDAGRGSKSQQVREAVGRKVIPFRMVELERECPGVSRDTIRLVLREMKKEGLVKTEGRGRGARWRNLGVTS